MRLLGLLSLVAPLASCAPSNNVLPQEHWVTTYYDRNHDGIVDFELHTLGRGHADADWGAQRHQVSGQVRPSRPLGIRPRKEASRSSRAEERFYHSWSACCLESQVSCNGLFTRRSFLADCTRSATVYGHAAISDSSKLFQHYCLLSRRNIQIPSTRKSRFGNQTRSSG